MKNRRLKKREDCRDVLVNMWTSDFYCVRREGFIGNNRTDIEVFHKLENWKVRIECKVDENQSLFKAVREQLIKKYLENKAANYGIYLVFYFGERKKSIDSLKSKIESNIPTNWKDKIKDKFINLSLVNK